MTVIYTSKMMVQAKPLITRVIILNIESKTSYCLNENLFLFIQDDIAQILDFDRGEFYGLDRIATVMESLVLEQSIEEP